MDGIHRGNKKISANGVRHRAKHLKNVTESLREGDLCAGPKKGWSKMHQDQRVKKLGVIKETKFESSKGIREPT